MAFSNIWHYGTDKLRYKRRDRCPDAFGIGRSPAHEQASAKVITDEIRVIGIETGSTPEVVEEGLEKLDRFDVTLLTSKIVSNV